MPLIRELCEIDRPVVPMSAWPEAQISGLADIDGSGSQPGASVVDEIVIWASCECAAEHRAPVAMDKPQTASTERIPVF